MKTQGEIVVEVINELERGCAKFSHYASAHEGYAVILEELDEMWDCIKENVPEMAAKEAIQVAATALRFAFEFQGEMHAPLEPVRFTGTIGKVSVRPDLVIEKEDAT